MNINEHNGITQLIHPIVILSIKINDNYHNNIMCMYNDVNCHLIVSLPRFQMTSIESG